jgi:hypothetical protein
LGTKNLAQRSRKWRYKRMSKLIESLSFLLSVERMNKLKSYVIGLAFIAVFIFLVMNISELIDGFYSITQAA